MNAVPARASRTLVRGDRVAVVFPAGAPPRQLRPAQIPLTVVWEDEHLAVIDKPAGLVVHPAPGHWDDTLVNALIARGTTLAGGAEGRPGIVHRLDRDTSGLMIVAKTDLAHRRLGHMLAARRVTRAYAALAWGHLAESPTVITAPLGRHPRDRKRMAIVATGRAARTDAYVVARFGSVDLLRLELHSGRTHQIRVHLEHVGHPLVGDPVYAGGGVGASPARHGSRRRPWSAPRPGRLSMPRGLRFATLFPAWRSTSGRSGPPISGRRWRPRAGRTSLLARTRLPIFFSSIDMSEADALPAVIFRVGDLVCAVPAGRIREVLDRLPATRIPGVPFAVEGLVNVRGGLLTVADAHALLGRPMRPEDEGAILVLDFAGRRFGLAVSQVLDFVEFPPGSVSPRDELPGVDPALVRAVAARDDRHFILLDIDALLAPMAGGNPEPLGGGQ